jgi:hypothetical protein
MAHYTAEGSQAMRDYRLRSQEMMLDKGYGIVGNYSSVSGYTADGKRRQYISSHYMYNEHLWVHKIKKALDPNNVSDATFYSPE